MIAFFIYQGVSTVKRASAEELKAIYDKYATGGNENEKLMTSSDFIRGFLGLFPDANFNPRSVSLLGGIIDTSKDGYIPRRLINSKNLY